MLSAPRCNGNQPWKAEPFVPCCPAACAERYEAERKSGAAPMQSFRRVLYGEGKPEASCVPVLP
jgi:hypothetical protein